MTSPLQQEFDYYLANQAEMVKAYNGKFVVIKGRKVIGTFDERGAAVAETAKQHEVGTFLVQKVEPGDGAYTHTYYSRASFLNVP